jgi:polysaccharide deacetylase 2 family uncharacterized protein YibQ
LYAFGLVVVLVAISIGISSAVIFIHSKSKELPAQTVKENELPSNLNVGPEANTQSNISQPDKQTEPARQPPEQERKSLPSANTSAPVAGNTPVSPAKKQNVTNTSAPTVNNSPLSLPQKQNVTSNTVSQKPAENYGTLVFVIDDAGNNLRELEPFLRIPFPLTIAVLPGLPNSAEAAKRIRSAGKDVILHQPMEAIGGQNPGPQAIYSGMSAQEIRSILSRNITEVGPVAGMNNHQGSKVTMDSEAMETILAFCREQGIYFLDSRTTSETSVPAAARRLGIKIAERDIFIDNEQDRDSMLRYITSGLARAQKNGHAVMIGHTWSPALAPLLAERFPLLTSQGYTIKTASDIIKLK